MSNPFQNMKQLESHWRDLQNKNIKESTTKKRCRNDENPVAKKQKNNMIQNRKIVKLVKK
tara:strand:+ start:295 stop:474 length:180 start_codon:yes stop_codon:yes gene_type:complete